MAAGAPGRPSRRGRLIDPAELADPSSVRPDGGAVLDLHAHSSDLSLDSGVTAEAIAAQAAARGLDGICLTEHNSLWAAEAIRELSERHEVTVIPGMGLGTDVGHVLVFGLDRYSPELLLIDGLCAIARSEGAAMVLAHPMRSNDGPRPGWAQMGEWFDALEAINGDHSDGEDGYFVRLAAELGLAAVGGSDVHSRHAVGRAATAFPEPVPDVRALARLLRAGSAAPVDLRPGVT